MTALVAVQPFLPEVRLYHDDFPQVLTFVTGCLEQGQPVVIQFAAEGSCVPITVIPREGLTPARPFARFAHGNEIDAQMDGALFIVRGSTDSGDRTRAVWKGLGHWDIHPVVEHLCPNITDALPLYILLSELEIARGRVQRDDHLRREYEDTIRNVMRWKYGMGHDTLPPTWVENYKGEEVVMTDVIRRWFSS